MWRKNRTFLAVWTWNRCWLIENVEKKSHFFCCLNLETGAGLLKMWRKNRTLFFCCLNLEQVLAYWKCGKNRTFLAVWTWNMCWLIEKSGEKIRTFFLRSEPGTGAGLLKMWRKKSNFFLAVWNWNRCWLTENVEKKSHFFWRSELGTGAGLLKMWRKIRTFFCCLNLEQVLAYWKCDEKNRTFFAVWTWNRCWLTENLEKKIALFWLSEPGTGAGLLKIWRKKSHLFGGMNLEQVLAYWKCGEEGIAFFFLRSEPGTGASLLKMWRGNRTFFAVWTWNRC